MGQHPDLDWRIKTVAYAKRYPELEHAKLLIEKEKERNVIAQDSLR